ncbi:hypothetical protein B0I26_10184 [Anoxybacillus vitaminiphilus]|uniref:Uncharacterized protein n=1 Tax=Paranoxybacillus vitaminiphilus TaxID=581036 RepID=A0A327YQB1_9BACL|nr:hypothetical protein B0I26_10184 [Anoxybacillus vitaminiphilus]
MSNLTTHISRITLDKINDILWNVREVRHLWVSLFSSSLNTMAQTNELSQYPLVLWTLIYYLLFLDINHGSADDIPPSFHILFQDAPNCNKDR